MGLFGLFTKKGKDIDIPPPPPPIISSEPIPRPLKEPPKFIQPKAPEHAEEALNIEDFIPREKEQVFTTEMPNFPDFSKPIHPGITPELKPISSEDFGAAVLEGEEPLEHLHRPEPIVPPSKPKEFKGISRELRKVEERQIGKPVKRQALNEPLFVKADDYKSLLGALNVIKVKIGDSEKILSDLNELKNIKDKTFEKWRNELEDIQRKLLYIDKTLYEER